VGLRSFWWEIRWFLSEALERACLRGTGKAVLLNVLCRVELSNLQLSVRSSLVRHGACWEVDVPLKCLVFSGKFTSELRKDLLACYISLSQSFEKIF
jgi:hypothetical protein